MTTAPYAKLRANIASAGNLTGVLTGAPGATCQLSQDPAGLGSTWLYEITDYPEGWACPTGWTASSLSGVYSYSGLTPPSFTLPALPLWGKLALRLTVNSGDPGTSGLDKTQFVDSSTVISTPDPSGAGYEDIAYGESNQWDPKRKWLGALKRNIRRMAAGSAGNALGPYTSAANRQAASISTADLYKYAIQTDTGARYQVLPGPGGSGVQWGIAATPESAGPLVLMAGHVRFGFSGDIGLTTSGWTDQGPGAHSVSGTVAVAAAALGGKAAAQFNGTSHALSSTFATAAPGTTNVFVDMIVRVDTFGFAAALMALSSANDIAIIQDSGTAEAALFNLSSFGPRHASGLTLSTFKRLRAKFTGTGTDLIQVGGGAAVTAAAAGNTAGTGLYLGFSNGAYAAISIAELWGYDADPSSQRSALDAYWSTKYGVTFP